jgi:CDP-glucose 4,6-dehydratase
MLPIISMPNPEFWKNKRVYVTGARGFKGRWLVRWLYLMGSIIETDEYIDICDSASIRGKLISFMPEIVIHMAAVATIQEAFMNPEKTIRTNVEGTLTLLNVLKGIPSIKAILNVTTDKVYHIAGIDRGYKEEDALGGLEPYSVSKACSELVSIMFQKTYKLPLATARAGNVVGGGDWKETRIVPNYMAAMKEGRPLDVNADAIRPWQYVLDALCGYLILCERLYDNKSFVGAWNFASNEYESRSVQWLVDELNRYFTPPVKYRLIDERGYYETKSLKLCSEKAHNVLGWKPRFSMTEMIKHTAEWYIAFYEGQDLTDMQIEQYVMGAKNG